MQVADRSDHITHAVLGGKTNISFGISDDPAFFQILSSSLYKNPVLAMVRETICNAWDAHIDSGRSDRPITITLNEEKLVIRDYGNGIPNDLIGPIYGVYGASTKKNDGRQTGGFGLGCKSPFAYTDHFEVVSHHAGVRTIYNMSKSSAEKMGKPSIVPIASFPTTETGIQVTIDLLNSSDLFTLNQYVSSVVYNGDILATLNASQLPILGLSSAELGFILLNRNAPVDIPNFSLKARISLRYGNVIYPVEASSEIETLYDKVSNVLDKRYNCAVVLMAPPDSISVTPSRESLTNSTLTTETLKKLLSSLLARLLKVETTTRHKELTTKYILQAAAENAPLSTKLNRSDWGIPGIPSHHPDTCINTVEQLTLMDIIQLRNATVNGREAKNWLSGINQYLDEVAKTSDIDRGLLRTWKETARKGSKLLKNPGLYSSSRYYGNTPQHTEEAIASAWWCKRVLLPLMGKLSTALGTSVVDSLHYLSANSVAADYKGSYRAPVAVVKSVSVKNHTSNLIHLMKPSVVLCHNANKIGERLSHLDKKDYQGGTFYVNTSFVLEISRQAVVVQNTKQKLQTLVDAGDIELIDLTGRTATEQREFESRARRKANALSVDVAEIATPKVRKTGLVRLDQLIGPSGFDTQRISLDSALRLTTPKFIAQMSTHSSQREALSDTSKALSKAVARLWGDQGVVTNSKATYSKHIKGGVMDLTAFVADKLATEVITDPALIAHMQFDSVLVDDYLKATGNCYTKRSVSDTYRRLMHIPELSHLIPGYVPLSSENRYKLIVWHTVLRDFVWLQIPEVAAARKTLKDVELSQSTKDFLDKLMKNPFLGLLDTDALEKASVSARKDPVQLAKLIAVVTQLIN